MNTVILGGATFDLPQFPFRLTRRLQPAVIDWMERSRSISPGDGGRQGFKETFLQELADLAFDAIKHSAQGKELTREQFEELPISTAELGAAIVPILSACGLEFPSEPTS